jgi:hypothetical protein
VYFSLVRWPIFTDYVQDKPKKVYLSCGNQSVQFFKKSLKANIELGLLLFSLGCAEKENYRRHQ